MKSFRIFLPVAVHTYLDGRKFYMRCYSSGAMSKELAWDGALRVAARDNVPFKSTTRKGMIATLRRRGWFLIGATVTTDPMPDGITVF